MKFLCFKDISDFLRGCGEEKSEYTVLALETLGISKQTLLLYPQREIEKEKQKLLYENLKRFESREPLQYILGKWDFLGREYKVGEGVLIPREDTGTVIELAAEILADTQDKTFADLGSGSGCIAVTLACDYKMQGFAVERSDKAYAYLSQNIKMAGGRAEALLGDMFSKKILDKIPKLDLVISNPPYITAQEMKDLDKRVLNEPTEALFGGEDGLDYYREIARVYKDKLKDGAAICFEVGFRQADDVLEILKNEGYKNPCEKKDFSKIRRAVGAFK